MSKGGKGTNYFGFPSRFAFDGTGLVLIKFLTGLGLFSQSETGSGIVPLCKTREN